MNKKLFAFASLCFSLCLLCNSFHADAVYSSNPTKDSYVWNKTGYTDTNFGSATSLYLGGSYFIGINRTFVEFSVSLPTYAVVTSTILKLYVTHLRIDGYNCRVYNVTGSWSEMGITWNNQPTVGSYIATTVPTSLGWWSINITSIFTLNSTVGYMIKMVTENALNSQYTQFDSKEGTHPPSLEITYTTYGVTVIYDSGVSSLLINDTVKGNTSVSQFTGNTLLNFTSILNEHYAFANYTYNASYNVNNPFYYIVTANVTVYAYTTSYYYLTVNSPHGVTSGEDWYIKDDTAYVGLDTDSVFGDNNTILYTFINWSGDASGTDFSSSLPITMDSNKTAIANWETKYLLTIYFDDGINIFYVDDADYVNCTEVDYYGYGSSVNLTVTMNSGYNFKEYTYDGLSNTSNPFYFCYDILSPISVFAHSKGIYIAVYYDNGISNLLINSTTKTNCSIIFYYLLNNATSLNFTSLVDSEHYFFKYNYWNTSDYVDKNLNYSVNFYNPCIISSNMENLTVWSFTIANAITSSISNVTVLPINLIFYVLATSLGLYMLMFNTPKEKMSNVLARAVSFIDFALLVAWLMNNNVFDMTVWYINGTLMTVTSSIPTPINLIFVALDIVLAGISIISVVRNAQRED